MGLAMVTDQHRQIDLFASVGRLPAASMVIVRHRDEAQRRSLALALRPLCRSQRLFLLVAGDIKLAIELGAGLHLPEHMLKQPLARIRLWHRQGRHIMTAAAHNRSALVKAHRGGVDAAFLSPVFPTKSHPQTKALGGLSFRRMLRYSKIPIFALGGINGRSVLALRQSGAAGIAAIDGLSVK
ncbi:MAG TPA: thiamine phosphate synthase [Rhodospirillaceae bacterium]|nr:thiamine phosphate synthase [Rhodospirillaceae bacterium]